MRSFSLLALLFLVAGCSQSSFLGSRVNDFTAYYNKFYNAQRSFEEEVDRVEEQDRPIDRTEYLALFPAPQQAQQGQQLDATIKKSADVLRDHPNSRWVDDALLLIGKSYFYQQNYAAAEQKFREVVTLGTGLEDEARFWLARSQVASGAYDAAAQHIEESLLRAEEVAPQWKAKLHLALGDLYIKRGAWEAAAAELEAGLETVRDKKLAARAQFALGQVYETLERYDEAADAYRRVERHRPLFELSYAAKLSAIRVAGMYGDAAAALEALRRLERDDKYYENRAELAFLRGRIYQAQDRADDAESVYHSLLYDTDADIQSVRGPAHYALGELYRDHYGDFISAAAHFDTAATALSRGPAATNTDHRPPAAVIDSREQADMFKSYADVRTRVDRADSLLYLGSLDEAAFEEAILRLRQQRAEELAAARERQARQASQQRFQELATSQQSDDTFDDRQSGSGSALSTDAAGEPSAANEAGFLFYKDAMRVREGKLGFIERWGRRPLVPNWRRLEAVQAVATEEAAAQDVSSALRGLDPEAEDNTLPEVDISAVPRDPESRRAMRTERAVAAYEMGNVLFIQMGRPDSAATWYRRVIEQESDQLVAQRAYYALAEVQRALGDTLAAQRLYQEVLTKYPDSELASRVRVQLGQAPVDSTQAGQDSLRAAEEAYAAAYDRWQQGRFTTALREMVQVAATHAQTPIAPRALLAAGSIYLEWARRDSLDVTGKVPVAFADSVLAQAGLLTTEAPPTMRPPATEPVADTTAISEEGRLAAASDTLAAPADSVQGLPDESVQAAPVDSVHAPPADSAAADSAAAPPTWTAVADTTDATLTQPAVMAFYAAVTERYPQAPEADLARRMLQVLEERAAPNAPSVAATDTMQVQQLPDSIAEAVDTSQTAPQAFPSDRLVPEAEISEGEQAAPPPVDDRRLLDERRMEERVAEEEAAAADSTAATPRTLHRDAGQVAPVRDTTAQGHDVPSQEQSAVPSDADPVPQEVQPVPEAPAEPVEPTTGLDPAAGGWTIVVGSSTDRKETEAALQHFAEQLGTELYPMGLLESTTDGTSRYRVGIGQFASADAAEAARRKLSDRLPEDAWVLRLGFTP